MGCLCKQIFNVRLYHALAELVNTLTSNSTYGFISTEFEHPPITRTKVAIILQTCPLGHSIHRVHSNLQCHAPYILFFTLLSTLCTFCLHSVDSQSITQCRQISIMPTLLSAHATPACLCQGGAFISLGRPFSQFREGRFLFRPTKNPLALCRNTALVWQVHAPGQTAQHARADNEGVAAIYNISCPLSAYTCAGYFSRCLH